jgi:hypothetical protein
MMYLLREINTADGTVCLLAGPIPFTHHYPRVLSTPETGGNFLRQGQYLGSKLHPPTIFNPRKMFGPLVFGHEVGCMTGFLGPAEEVCAEI